MMASQGELKWVKELLSIKEMKTKTGSKWIAGIKFGEFLGSGSFGYVFNTDNTTESLAIKICFEDNSDKEHSKYIIREYNNLVGKRHDNVVRIIGIDRASFTKSDLQTIFKFNSQPYEETVYHKLLFYMQKATLLKSIKACCIQMELCGKTLRSWLNEGIRSDDVQANIVVGIIQGLKYIHSKGILHRDLKPENIYFAKAMINYVLPVKIGDFTLSTLDLCEDMTKQVGTPLYRALEVNYIQYGRQADFYSLGLVIWEVLQKIEYNERREFFHKLVFERQENLVQDHSTIRNAKEIIIHLTRQKTSERLQTIDDLTIQVGDYSGANLANEKTITEWDKNRVDLDTNRVGANYQENNTWMDSIKLKKVLQFYHDGFMFEAEPSCVITIIFKFPDKDQYEEKLLRQHRIGNYNLVQQLSHDNIVKTLKYVETTFNSKDIDKLFSNLRLNDDLRVQVEMHKAQTLMHGFLTGACTQLQQTGPSLRHWLDNRVGIISKAISQQQFEIVKGLMEGMKYLESKSVCHRNIRPENIFFSGLKNQLPIKIGEFSRACILDGRNSIIEKDKFHSSTGKDTQEIYTDPRIWSGCKYDGMKADMFSLGLVIWEVIQFFEKGQKEGYFYRLVHYDETKLIQKHPIITNCVDIIVKLTNKNVEERPNRIQDVKLCYKEGNGTTKGQESGIITDVLEKAMQDLCQHTTVSDSLLSPLSTVGVITKELESRIRSMHDDYTKAAELFGFIHRSGSDKDFPKLKQALADSRNSRALHIIEKVEKDLITSKRNEAREVQ